LDDSGKGGNAQAKRTQDGQRDFVNLGSSTKPRHDNEEQKEHVPSKVAVKPTFKGKANLTKTGGG
jgi:hypothetical protein